MVMEGDLTWDGEHTTHGGCIIEFNANPESYLISITNVTPINSIKKM